MPLMISTIVVVVGGVVVDGGVGVGGGVRHGILACLSVCLSTACLGILI